MTDEKKYFADIAIPPGETLLEMLEENNMTQAELAKRIDMSRKHINQLIKGKTSLTAETAIKLEKIFELPANFWLNLETDYQEAKARINDKNKTAEKQILYDTPYSEMIDLGWVKKGDSEKEKIDNLKNFFRVSDLTSIKNVYNVAYRTSKPEKTSSLALAAWLERGKYLANNTKTKKFSRKVLKSYIPLFKKMTNRKPENFYKDLKKKLAKCGIAFVIVPFLTETYAHGAIKWLSPEKALIQLSLRYKYADIFWFSFFHEIGHLLLHSKKETFIEYDSKVQKEVEKEADNFAADVLIPKKKYEIFIRNNNFTEKSVIKFAKNLNINPGIVVGRLQHDEIVDYSQFNFLRKKYSWKQFNI